MKEYEELIETLVGMATISRPRIAVDDDAATQRYKNIQHSICDLMEDAAVAIDALLNKLKGHTHVEERAYAEAS